MVSFLGVVIGMKLGCERRLGGLEPKKKGGHESGRGEVRPGWDAAKKQPGNKRKQSVKKVREGTHSQRGQRMGGR